MSCLPDRSLCVCLENNLRFSPESGFRISAPLFWEDFFFSPSLCICWDFSALPLELEPVDSFIFIFILLNLQPRLEHGDMQITR